LKGLANAILMTFAYYNCTCFVPTFEGGTHHQNEQHRACRRLIDVGCAATGSVFKNASKRCSSLGLTRTPITFGRLPFAACPPVAWVTAFSMDLRLTPSRVTRSPAVTPCARSLAMLSQSVSVSLRSRDILKYTFLFLANFVQARLLPA